MAKGAHDVRHGPALAKMVLQRLELCFSGQICPLLLCDPHLWETFARQN